MNVDVPITEVYQDGFYKMKVTNVRVKQGDTIEWDFTGRTVRFWFPHPGILESSGKDVSSQVWGIQNAVFAAEVVGNTAGRYEYGILYTDVNDFAIADSHPIVEIPRPGP